MGSFETPKRCHVERVETVQRKKNQITHVFGAWAVGIAKVRKSILIRNFKKESFPEPTGSDGNSYYIRREIGSSTGIDVAHKPPSATGGVTSPSIEAQPRPVSQQPSEPGACCNLFLSFVRM